MNENEFHERVDRWSRLRFSIIGGLLAAPPAAGDLQQALEVLARRRFRHPIDDRQWVQFSVSTIERWYYKARHAVDPMAALRRQVRSDIGRTRVMSPDLIRILHEQYRAHPGWSYQLHADNLAAQITEHESGLSAPSYSTILRFMKGQGWRPRKSVRSGQRPGREAALQRLEQREVRSYETPTVHGLWHSDFHHGRRQIVDQRGRYHTPKALCILDDCSRLCCHIQWYLDETAATFVHGLSQAFYKRGLPRALMTDNGAAMLSGEVRNGLARLGITHETTLPYSPWQNGKQEAMWGQLEGRLMAMLDRYDPITLDQLNEITQAWIERDYQRRRHSELAMSPLERMLQGPEVSRPAPSAAVLREAFCLHEQRTQRRSDGTITIKGVRFEIPSRFRHLERLMIGYQSWDLSRASLVDQRTGAILGHATPLDKASHAHGKRRSLKPSQPDAPLPKSTVPSETLPPLLRHYLQDYAATGLPPAYIPVIVAGESPTTISPEDHDE